MADNQHDKIALDQHRRISSLEDLMQPEPSTPSIRIAYLADEPQHLAQVARWIYDQWGRERADVSYDMVLKRVRAHLHRRRLPLAVLALSGDTPLGTASLRPYDLPTHTQFTPWLASVYVAQEYRNQGIGSQVVTAAEQAARWLNIDTLYLWTPDRESFYARLGWITNEHTQFRSQSIVIMRKSLL